MTFNQNFFLQRKTTIEVEKTFFPVFFFYFLSITLLCILSPSTCSPVKPELKKLESGVGLCEKEEEEEEEDEEEEMEGRESDSGMSEGAVGASGTSPCSQHLVEDAKRLVESVIGVHVEDVGLVEKGGRGGRAVGIVEEDEEGEWRKGKLGLDSNICLLFIVPKHLDSI